jgi:hypothetical protein
MSSDGAARSAAVALSNARAEASRKNGARSRGPKTPEGKARSAQNALRHGLCALRYVVLPDESAAEFQALQEALIDELAPEGALQLVLARRVAVAAWRLARADRMEVELFEERRWEAGDPLGLALIRDGNGTRSFETLMRYRGAAMAEFMRALKTLKALQAGQAAEEQAASAIERTASRPAAQASRCVEPNEPKSGALRRLDYVLADLPAPGPTLHEAVTPWPPDQPETAPGRTAGASGRRRTNPKPAGIGAR